MPVFVSGAATPPHSTTTTSTSASTALAADARRQIIGRWLELRANGDDVVMLAATNESVFELNRAAQRLRLAAGEVVRLLRPVTLIDGAQALIGDEVQTRQNDRSLTTDAGVSVKNRHRWFVDGIGADG